MGRLRGGLPDQIEELTTCLLKAEDALTRNARRVALVEGYLGAALEIDHVEAHGEVRKALDMSRAIRRRISRANGGAPLHEAVVEAERIARGADDGAL